MLISHGSFAFLEFILENLDICNSNNSLIYQWDWDLLDEKNKCYLSLNLFLA